MTFMLERLLRLAMRLYPADFRERFGAEIQLDFRRVMRDAAPRRRALVFVCDLFAAGMRERARVSTARVTGLVSVTLCLGHFAYDLAVPDRMGVNAILMTTVIGIAGLHLFVTHPTTRSE